MAMVWRNRWEDRKTEGNPSQIPYYEAAYGANSEPNISMKLIGGRHKPVIEKHVTGNQYINRGGRIQLEKPIAEKPNHLDPRFDGVDPSVYYHKDMQSPAYFKRPDSKDIVRGQLKHRPDIEKHRKRNDMSTVFEAEPWTSNLHPPLASDTEYDTEFTKTYYAGQEMDMNSDIHKRTSGGNFVSEYDKHQLVSLVPRNALLPVDPIKLTPKQEASLYKLICNELHRFNPKELRDVYVECSRWDKHLEGFCALEVLDNTLRSHNAYLSDTLRIISAQFVDTRRPGYVNYEQVLSYIGYALTLSENGHLFKSGSMHQDRELAKLFRTVEQELSKNTYTFYWKKWRETFDTIDRDHRGTLSSAQIKDICYDQHLPLSDSLINKILALCDTGNRDGQYRWQDFLNFLSRIRPANTGSLPPKQDVSPKREHQATLHSDKAPAVRNVRERESKRRGRREQREEVPYRSRDEQITHLSHQIHDLEKKYQITKDGIAATDKPWSDRFILMAQALYNIDTGNKGSLPRKDVMDIVRQYNTALGLDLDMSHVDMLTIAPENLDKSGNIILRAFLNRISSNGTTSTLG